MSDAAWHMSDLTGWITGTVALVALWRTGRVRVLDLRLTVRKGIAEIGVDVDHLARRLEYAVQSRTGVASATGQAGALQAFREQAEADRAEIQAMRQRLQDLNRLSMFATYLQVEDRAVGLETVRTLYRQLSEKYDAAIRDDDAQRTYLRERRDATFDRMTTIR
jgi:hypothetical protein